MSDIVIQLGLLSREDDRLWWNDCYLWDIRDEVPDTVQRPTEIAAFHGLFRQARLLKKRGVFINLTPLHLQAMQLEYHAMNTAPHPDNIYNWIAGRMRGITPLQIKALLDECSLVVLLREALGMRAIRVDWAQHPVVVKKAA